MATVLMQVDDTTPFRYRVHIRNIGWRRRLDVVKQLRLDPMFTGSCYLRFDRDRTGLEIKFDDPDAALMAKLKFG